MGSAATWEQEHQASLQAIAEAMDNNDPYLAGEILERIAPQPIGENVQIKEMALASLSSREVEVIDPKTGQIDNPNGPAVIKSDGTRKWYTAGMLHNATGPAILKPNGAVEYYYLGVKCKNAAELDDMVKKANEHALNTTHLRNAQPDSDTNPSI